MIPTVTHPHCTMPLTPMPLTPPIVTQTHETIFIPLGQGRQAVCKITIQTDGLHSMDRPTLAPPTARDLHELSEKLFHRTYQFHPED